MRIRNLALAASAVFLFTGCESDTPSQPGVIEADGTYELETVNDADLPFRLENIDDDNNTDLTSSSITLNSDGTFSDVSAMNVRQNGEVTTVNETVTGTYTISGTNVNFMPIDGPPHNAVLDLSNGLMTRDVDGNTYQYRAF